MINSRNRNKRSRLFPLLISGALVTFASVVGAQEKPKSLVPSFVDGQLEKSPTTAPKPLGAPVGAEDTAPVDTDDLPTVVTGDLGAVHPVSISLLQDGALGSDMWQGTDPNFVIRLMKNLTPPAESATAVGLYRRLLQSGGAVGGGAVVSDQVLDLRFEKLLKAGLTDDVISLAGRLPANAQTPKRHQYQLEAQLIAGEGRAACEVTNSIETHPDIAAFLSSLAIFCHLAAGQYDRADVKYALMEELGDITPFFASLYARAAGGKQSLTLEQADWSPLNTALYTLIPADKKSTVDIKDVQNPAALKQIYLSAEKGTVDSLTLLAKLYNAGLISVSELEKKLPNKQPSEEAAGQYSRYYAALADLKKTATDEDRIAALLSLWQAPNNMPDYRMVAVLSMPELEKLAGQAEAPEFALEAVKASLVAGRADLAQNWERIARRTVFQGEAEQRLIARKIVSRIDMYMLVSGEKAIARWTENSLNDWITATEDQVDQAPKASLLVSQMEVFGHGVTDADWQSLLRLPQPLWQVKSNHSLENTLVLAATGGQKGATVALALMMIGNTPLSDISLTSLRAVTAGLRAVGLQEVANRIALEAFIARGV